MLVASVLRFQAHATASLYVHDVPRDQVCFGLSIMFFVFFRWSVVVSVLVCVFVCVLLAGVCDADQRTRFCALKKIARCFGGRLWC